MEVHGDIDEADVLRLVQLAESTNEPVLYLWAKEPGTIEIRTGVLINPKFGHGTLLTARQRDGLWEIVNRTRWIA
jgi:hypothetical protein